MVGGLTGMVLVGRWRKGNPMSNCDGQGMVVKTNRSCFPADHGLHPWHTRYGQLVRLETAFIHEGLGTL